MRLVPSADFSPDLILYNANVITCDDAFSTCQAIAIGGDRFLATGSAEEVRSLAGRATLQIDLEGASVVPGLIDAHNHQLWTGLSALRLQLGQARSIADIVHAVQGQAREVAPGSWIIGSQDWRDTMLEERRSPTRFDLDPVSPEHPVYLPHGGHLAVVNSAALRLAGIDEQAPDPPSAHLGRTPDGRLDGILFEQAALDLVLPLLPPQTMADKVAALREICTRYNAAGITGTIDPGLLPEDLRAYQQVWIEGGLTVRGRPMVLVETTRGLEANLAAIQNWGMHTGFGDSSLRLGALKIFYDGGVPIRTAWLRQPYEGEADFRGIRLIEEAHLLEVIRTATRLGWQVGIHASGDAAVDSVLRVFGRVDEETPIAPLRHFLIHAHLADQATIREARRLGVPVVVQPGMIYRLGANLLRYIGEERANRDMPLRWWLDGGVVVAGSSDSPVTPFPPLLGIWAAVAREMEGSREVLGRDQRVSRREALWMYTRAPAYLSHEEHTRGSIEVGKLADCVVLSQDPLACPVEAISAIRPLATLVGGSPVYSQGTFDLESTT